jgi:hypothetical protein
MAIAQESRGYRRAGTVSPLGLGAGPLPRYPQGERPQSPCGTCRELPRRRLRSRARAQSGKSRA